MDVKALRSSTRDIGGFQGCEPHRLWSPAPNTAHIGAAEMSLNFDIIFLIMSFLHISDLLSVMITCRELHTYGIRRLISSGIHLEGSRFIKFCHFMLNNPSARFAFLHKLSFGVAAHHFGDMDNPIRNISLITQVLSRTPHLHTLLVSHFDALLAFSGKFIQSSFAGLTSLKRLHIHNLGMDGRDIFQQIRPLLHIEIRFSRKIFEIDPLTLLAESSSSLESLELWYCSFRQQGEVHFPRVTVLKLHYCNYHDIRPLTAAFPNLRELYVSYEANSGQPMEMYRYHDQNRSYQLRHSWTSLELVHGDILSIYALALGCQVRRLSVVRPRYCNPHFPRSVLGSVLTHTRPSHYAIEIDTDDPTFKYVMTLSDIAPQITHLSMRLLSCHSHRQPSAIARVSRTAILLGLSCTLTSSSFSL